MSGRQIHVLPFLLLALSLAILTSGTQGQAEEEPDQQLDFAKRLYDFGLGKRAYSYVSEYKRLPVYNFGLGKRSKLYNFGLGKRSDEEPDNENNDYDYEYEAAETEDPEVPEEQLYEDEDIQTPDKRNKMYSFGLGKRKSRYEFGLGKRLPKYDFGLGKRSKFNFGLGKREKLYSFGLGKRNNRLYSFGLGKRPVDQNSRFSFGLGKRSYDDLNDEMDKRGPQPYSFGMGKREVKTEDLEEMENKAEGDHHDHENAGHSNHNQTVELDSHEVMGHSDRVTVHKRSPRMYNFGLGKRDEYLNSEFQRQYRNPYSFGLGKRVPKYDFGLGKRSYDH